MAHNALRQTLCFYGLSKSADVCNTGAPAHTAMHPKTSDHILVVDDDPEIRRMVADYLRKNGLRATEVAEDAKCARHSRPAPST